MSEETKFDKMWNAPKMKRFIGVLYSLGASVVIVGAMGKILHTEWGGFMLGVGMTVEAILFALGAFDKPHKEYDWNKVLDFENGQKVNAGGAVQAVASSPKLGVAYTESISDDDVRKLSEGIRNLSQTANQLSSISNVAKSTENLVKNIDVATEATGKFVGSQDVLNTAASKLEVAYKSIADGIQAVDKNTKVYAAKVDDINKSLASINSIYEIQIKNVQAQSESLVKQSDTLRALDTNLNAVNAELVKIKNSTEFASVQSDLYKSGTEKLAKQVKDLNQVYGNMLNALN
jgi:gliding motility-associated protein GldL